VLAAGRDAFSAHRAAVEELLASTAADGIHLTTVLDEDYPVNLRVIDNLPPFLFCRGKLDLTDAFSVAVVGTARARRRGSRSGASLARRRF